MWKVNAGRRSVFASEFLNRSIVAIGWAEAGDYTSARSKEELQGRVKSAYPDWTDRQVEVSVGQIWRFLRDIRTGDNVLTYDPSTRFYHLGQVAGEARYEPGAIPSLPVQRSVTWRTSVSRDDLSVRAKGRLGAILTLFLVEDQTAKELESIEAAHGLRMTMARIPSSLPTTIRNPWRTLSTTCRNKRSSGSKTGSYRLIGMRCRRW